MTLFFQVFSCENTKVCSNPYKPVVATKKTQPGLLFKYGASNGLNFEPYCVKLAHHLLHDEYTINTIKMLLKYNYTNKRYNRNKS